MYPSPIALTRFDAAIVDLDGTLVDTLGDFEAALAGMLAELRLPGVSRAQVQGFVGRGSEHLITSVLSAACGNAAAVRLFDAGWQSYQAHYMRINGAHSRVFDGAEDGLRRLRAAGLRLSCLTNKPTAFAVPLLAAKGLDGYFDRVFGGDSFERKKPDPLPILKTCEALGTAPARTLVIGDSSNDAEAARAAGCPVLLVTYGYNHGQPVRGVDADGFLDSLAELG